MFLTAKAPLVLSVLFFSFVSHANGVEAKKGDLVTFVCERTTSTQNPLEAEKQEIILLEQTSNAQFNGSDLTKTVWDIRENIPFRLTRFLGADAVLNGEGSLTEKVDQLKQSLTPVNYDPNQKYDNFAQIDGTASVVGPEITYEFGQFPNRRVYAHYINDNNIFGMRPRSDFYKLKCFPPIYTSVGATDTYMDVPTEVMVEASSN